MYDIFYNLKAEPFRLSPDHRFCFNHRSYSKAKSYLQYAFHRAEGFVMITGRPGTGKTTLVNDLIDSLTPAEVSVAMLVCTQLEANDLLRMVAYSFGLEGDLPNKAVIIQQLTRLLTNHYKEGRRALLIIDEAQDLSVSALEELRLLTNLQLNSQPLLQIFLLGQEELKDLVQGPNMEQVHQRLVAAYNLEALKENETKQYIKHRLDQVGWKGDPALSEAVFPVIYKFSDGIPRRINLFCSRLFLHGSVEEKHALGVIDARVVISELQLENLASLNILSGIDFDTPDKYESFDPEPTGKNADISKNLANEPAEEEKVIESPIVTESPAEGIEQPQHSHHNEELSSNTNNREKDVQPKLAENGKSGAGNKKKKTRKKHEHDVAVSKNKEQLEKVEKNSNTNSSVSKKAGHPHVVQKSSQVEPKNLDSEIEALDSGLDGLTENVNALLGEKKELDQPIINVDTPVKPRNKFVALALIFTISLAFLTAVLFTTTPEKLDAKLDAAGGWMDGISVRVHTLLSSEIAPDEITHNVDTSPILTTPQSEAVSAYGVERDDPRSKIVDQTGQTEQTEQTEQTGIEEERSFNKAEPSDLEGKRNIQTEVEKSFDEEEIHNTAEVEQVSKLTTQSNDVIPANVDIQTDNNEVSAMQPVEKVELHDDPNKIAVDDIADTEIQQVDVNISGHNVEKKKENELGRLVKKVFFQFDSVDIQPDYFTELNDIAGQLDASPETSALVIGYSDNVGNDEYNLALSMKRARAVVSYLARQDISTDRLSVDGRGVHHNDVQSESNAEKMLPDMSRMVEIYFIPAN